MTATRHFSVLDPQIPYLLRIENVGVTADITLNGTKILARPKDSKSGVVTRPVTLLAENELTLELRGPPRSHLTLQITGADSVPPTITAIVTPTPNEAGWNNTDVTVSFSCEDATSGIESCPAPVTLSSEGAGQLVNGVARDRAGNTAEASVTINIDKTPPQLAITSPSPGAVVDKPSLTVTGTVSDALSGIASVTCNGTAASLSAETFTCSLTLVPGSNTITVSATDVAGNPSTAAIEVTFAQALDEIPPEQLQNFLNENNIDSAADFLERLPLQYKEHWIMVTKQESAQKSSPTEPRLLVPNKNASRVFSFCTGAPCREDFIEYLQFDESSNKFRFHEIDFPDGKPPKVKVDDPVCKGCHLDPPRPNWDAYDSWTNMLPFNRDRIYQGSEEDAAFKRLLKELKMMGKQGPVAVFEELLDFPKGITTDAGGNITIPYPHNDPGGDKDVFYQLNAQDFPQYTVCNPTPDSGCKKFTVTQGGNFFLVPHSQGDSDEGRGVELFDNFTGLNAKRVAQELLTFQKTPLNLEPSLLNPKNVDIRPIALAIADRCVNENNLDAFASTKALDAFVNYQLEVSQRDGMPEVRSFNDLVTDTGTRRHSLPKKKADMQAENMRGLICANRGFPPGKMCANPPNSDEITEEVAQRSLSASPLSGSYRADTLTRFMIDREDYGENTTIALFRFFLEPWDVGRDPWVRRWSMGVIGRSATYTFADVFSSIAMPPYRPEIIDRLKKSLESENKEVTCEALKKQAFDAFDAAFPLPSSARVGPAAETTDLPLVSPQGPDLVTETIGCDAATGLEFNTFNVGTESAEGFRNKIIFISKATGQQVGYPTIPGLDEQALVFEPGESTDLSVPVPTACFPKDVPFEQQGCDVLIYADSEGAVTERDDANNMDRGVCAP